MCKYLLMGQSDRGRETEKEVSVVHFPNAHSLQQNQTETRSEELRRGLESMRLSHLRLPGAPAGSWVGSRSRTRSRHSGVACVCPKGQLNQLTALPVFSFPFSGARVKRRESRRPL